MSRKKTAGQSGKKLRCIFIKYSLVYIIYRKINYNCKT